MNSTDLKLVDACEAFLRDLRARQLSPSSLRDYTSMFKSLQAFVAEDDADRHIREVDESLLRAWRETWNLMASTHRLRIQKLRSFFRFALKSGWIDRSPVENIIPPKADSPPTMPLSRKEVTAMLQSTDNMPKERAMLLLIRYSGLAIQDAATLKRAALDGHDLTLRRAKTGELVMLPLPDPVVECLRGLNRKGPYFFWTGKGQRSTTAAYWRNRLKLVASRAGVKDFRPHRLRDTFAVELLTADVSVEDVSTLLGHSSVKTTEKYYAPWNTARRKRLALVVRNANQKDPLLRALREKAGRKTGGSGTKGCQRSRGRKA